MFAHGEPSITKNQLGRHPIETFYAMFRYLPDGIHPSIGYASYLHFILYMVGLLFRRKIFQSSLRFSLDMTHIQYQGETPPFPLVLAFRLVLGKFHICVKCFIKYHI